MRVLLVFGLFVAIATSLEITKLEVPTYGVPHLEANLVCHYVIAKDDRALYSVKWFLELTEIFRFLPATPPYTYIFDHTIVVSEGPCDFKSCAISVIVPETYNETYPFTCEVTTAPPEFSFVAQYKYLTVAVLLKENPEILRVPETAELGDILLICTTQPAMPPANIAWFIDGKPEKTDLRMANNTHVLAANEFGLRSSWRSLRLQVATSNSSMDIRCEVTQPTSPPYTRSSNMTLEIA